MTNVAVVGVGGMGACHARHVAELADATLAWVADPDDAAGRALAAETGSEWLADGYEAIDRADAVVIAAPDQFHAGYLMAALDRQVPVLCEKPLTVELADAEAVVDREAAGPRRLIQLGFMREYDEAHRQVEEALADLGPVVHLRCVHRNTTPYERSLDEVLVQSLIHDIHSVRYLTGSEVTSVLTSTVDTRDRLRFVLLTCRLSSGAVATIEFDDAAAGYEVWVEADAERGNVIAAPPLRATVKSAGQVIAGIGDDWFAPFLNTYRVEMAAWLGSVRAGIATGPTAWDGLAAQAVVAAAAESAQLGEPVEVALAPTPTFYQEQTQ